MMLLFLLPRSPRLGIGNGCRLLQVTARVNQLSNVIRNGGFAGSGLKWHDYDFRLAIRMILANVPISLSGM